ncbi:NAD(P)-binding protein [Coniophora puteana RWD-64-598 SS2]|uniref:NAD(P)-binding protein n=1 Tax=Coniophora puteana (strain RWD-64-598) TaxID=741705 RepID=A0A5M3MCI1_CONPW|nr:NAD(P)-binding protein [Coniophora puteana RWD-64-598 SS2]EIW76929.1 NAD(P)-binding protein [Coniophora puteana RWD-64-598 SS2]
MAPLIVVAGIGNGSGTGAATARLFAKAGYDVALIARGNNSLTKFKDELTSAGVNAASFSLADYSSRSLTSAFAGIKSTYPNSPLRVALWNVAFDVRKPFLETTPEEVQIATDTNVVGAFAFSREVLQVITTQEPETTIEGGVAGDRQKKGTLLFTGATASVRGNTTTSTFAAGKHGIRALSQSLAKEFGKQNIHVAHVIIDGAIVTGQSRFRSNAEWVANVNVRLDSNSIAALRPWCRWRRRRWLKQKDVDEWEEREREASTPPNPVPP